MWVLHVGSQWWLHVFAIVFHTSHTGRSLAQTFCSKKIAADSAFDLLAFTPVHSALVAELALHDRGSGCARQQGRMPQWQGHVKRQRPQKRLRRHQSPRRTGQKKIAVTATAERLGNARTSHGLERARAQTEKEAAPHTEEDPHGERGKNKDKGSKGQERSGSQKGKKGGERQRQ